MLNQKHTIFFLCLILLTAMLILVAGCGSGDDDDDNDEDDSGCKSNDDCPDDGIWCNGVEACNLETGQCLHRLAPCQDDGFFCNGAETCDEANQECFSYEEPCPDDGKWCNGAESCDEHLDECIHEFDNDTPRCPDDGLWCNGGESCSEEEQACIHSGDACVDDGVYCNGTEYCDEENDQCLHTTNPCPDDGLWCNGEEYCDETEKTCRSETTPSQRCPDDGLFCNGLEYCDDVEDRCVQPGEPCVEDDLWCNGATICDEEIDRCVDEFNEENPRCPNDGRWCNGEESCFEGWDRCVVWDVPDCEDDGIWCNGEDFCDEANDECAHEFTYENPRCPDDGIWCNGITICDEYENACSWKGTCADHATCNEDEQACLPYEFIINTTTQNYQWNPVISVAADDSFIVAWTSGDLDDNGIFSQRFDSSGNTFGEEFQVNTYVAYDQYYPSVAMLTGGGFFIAWESEHGSGNDEINGQLFDAAGQPSGEEIYLNHYDNDDQREPVVAKTPSGGFIAAWQSEWIDMSDFAIVARLYDAEGNPTGNEKLINTYANRDQTAAALAVDSEGDIIVVWESEDQDGDDYGIYGQRFTFPFTFTGDEFPINQHITGSQQNPAIAVNMSGGFTVVWESEDQDGDDFGIFGRMFDSSAEPLTDEFQINTHTEDSQDWPAIAMDLSGNFVVVWQSDNQDTDEYGIYGQRFAADGTPEGDEFLINSYVASNQRRPSVAMTSDGGFIVVWQSVELFGTRFDSEGNPMVAPE